MNAEELDIAVAQEVFGVPRAVIDAWPWGVPAFSSQRELSSDVVGRMIAHPAREQFDAALESAARKWGWKALPEHSGISAAILVLTPDEICRAALAAIRECADPVST